MDYKLCIAGFVLVAFVMAGFYWLIHSFPPNKVFNSFADAIEAWRMANSRMEKFTYCVYLVRFLLQGGAVGVLIGMVSLSYVFLSGLCGNIIDMCRIHGIVQEFARMVNSNPHPPIECLPPK